MLERAGAPAADRVIHLVRAGDADGVVRLGPAAARSLWRAGAARAAAEILEGVHALGDEDARTAAAIDLADLYHGLGDYARAEERLADIVPRAKGDLRARALTLLGRIALARTDWAAAERALGEALAEAGDAAGRAAALRDLARVRVRRGDYAAADEAAREGLSVASPDDPTRIEMLLSRGLVASYGGQPDVAFARYEEALLLARRVGDKRDLASALGYLAIHHHRAGDYARATERYREALEIAREVGDVGGMATAHSNLGAVSFLSGDPARAREHYELAVRLARRVGRSNSAVFATNNLANLHSYLGMFERARKEAEEAFEAAGRLGLPAAAAQAKGTLGEIASREGRFDAALPLHEDAATRYEALGQQREAADYRLDEAETLVERGAAGDAERASALLDRVQKVADAEKLEDYRPRLALLRGRTKALRGAEEEALAEYEAALDAARTLRQRDVEWQVHAALADLYAVRGASLLARRRREVAVETLESISASLPREFRHSFWQVPRRREVRRRLEVTVPGAPARAAPGDEAQKLFRLAEVNKKLLSELDDERLFEAILDAAVELTGAERGFLLLADPSGDLQARAARQFGGGSPSPEHARFSRSIAESVFVDGEPVITVSAKNDERWNEYLSVHQLQLQSVLCIPIRARGRVLGVLYMENRFRPGRFDERDERILSAFGDQVAIALENARLHREVVDRQKALERANAELEGAKDEIERLLVVRTTERDEARHALTEARREIPERFGWRGIVGASEPMRRVFALLDRIRETDVPIVIQGESGTGKEVVARAIHEGGARGQKPFVAVNCAAIPDTLLESELFGHVRGSFTGADRDKRGLFVSADGGTLFLDEIGDMAMRMQTDLLRVLQERRVRPIGGVDDVPVDVRVLAACGKPLRELVSAGRFREDLYYRLNVVEISLPPLRERTGDIPLLIDHMLRAHATRLDMPKRTLSRGAVRRLCAYPWPGNVRQLEHVLLSAWVLSEGPVIGEADLRLEPVGSPARSAQPPATGDRQGDEKRRILGALEQTNWNRSRAAEVLGMPRRTFYRRLKVHGIQ
jgi:transcriptional regulator with GAF, ATPase, and Fis domain/Tfp pilus assembly protein PilF